VLQARCPQRGMRICAQIVRETASRRRVAFITSCSATERSSCFHRPCRGTARRAAAKDMAIQNYAAAVLRKPARLQQYITRGASSIAQKYLLAVRQQAYRELGVVRCAGCAAYRRHMLASARDARRDEAYPRAQWQIYVCGVREEMRRVARR